MRFRGLPLLFLNALVGCCLSTGAQGFTTGGRASTGSVTGSANATGTATGAAPSSGCWPGTIWVGDECVALDCANFASLPCQFSDGGLGTCQAGGCYALGSDPNNCGAIGAACPPSTTCLKGGCAYPDGGWAGCAEHGDGADRCGLEPCSAENENAACGGSGSFCCHGTCIPSDASNCGGCGITCGNGSICWYGRGCAPPVTCPSTADYFPPVCRVSDGGAGQCCGATCVDMSSDASNCSGCGLACPSGSGCSNATCSSNCSTNGDCPAGFECYLGPDYLAPGHCVPSKCAADFDGDYCTLDSGETIGSCCGGTCVALGSICNNTLCLVCEADQICDHGACIAPTSACTPGTDLDGYTIQKCFTESGAVGDCCGTACVEIGNDPLNCIGCGRACPAGGTCLVDCGPCGPTAPCPAGYTCEGELGCVGNVCDGTNSLCPLKEGFGLCCGSECVSYESFEADGGRCSCDGTCPPGSFCLGATCSLPDGRGACGGDSQLSTRTDCPPGTMCSLAQVCEQVRDCSPGSQTPGYGGCLNGPNDYASCCGDHCVNTFIDPQNCGGCGNACASGICAGQPQGPEPIELGLYGCLPAGPTDDCFPACGPLTVCVNASCVGSACGFNADRFCLDQDQTIGFCCGTGVCAHLLDDPENCGFCGNRCPAGQTCENGTCSGSPECPPGNMLGFCNLDAGVGYACCPSAGCTNLFTDPANCGRCGQSCPGASPACVAGVCGSSGISITPG